MKAEARSVALLALGAMLVATALSAFFHWRNAERELVLQQQIHHLEQTTLAAGIEDSLARLASLIESGAASPEVNRELVLLYGDHAHRFARLAQLSPGGRDSLAGERAEVYLQKAAEFMLARPEPPNPSPENGSSPVRRLILPAELP